MSTKCRHEVRRVYSGGLWDGLQYGGLFVKCLKYDIQICSF